MVGRIHIMGIVNLTPDSFFAVSRTQGADAVTRIRQLLSEGADVVDLGACSTRPGAAQPTLEEEWSRLEPALMEILGNCPPGTCPPPDEGRGRGPLETSSRRGRRIQWEGPERAERTEFPGGQLPPISIDTYRSEIVRRAYEVIGPFMVNDISAGAMDPEMLTTVGRLGLPYVAMHMKGTPETMQQFTDYGDIVADAKAYFRDFALRAADAGIQDWILDPGFGFAKTLEQNYELLRRMAELEELHRPILVGVSRKSMIYKLLGITPEEALSATQVVHFAALERGATWLRVHDVPEAVQTARLFNQTINNR